MAARRPLVNVGGVIAELPTADTLDGVTGGSSSDASSTVKGITELSVDPVDPVTPIAVGDNDARIQSVPHAAFWGGAFVRETVPALWGGSSTTAALTTLYGAYPITLYAGDVITNLTFVSNGGATSPTQWWFALYSPAEALLRQTAAQGNAAWAGATPKKLALTSSYTVPTTGVYYVVCYMAASTGVTLHGAAGIISGAHAAFRTAHPTVGKLARTSSALAATATAPATLALATTPAGAMAYCAAT